MTLSETSQSQKNICHLLLLSGGAYHSQIHRGRECSSGYWDGGQCRTGSQGFMGTGFQFCGMRRVQEADGGHGCTPVGMCLTPLSQALKNGSGGKFSVCFMITFFLIKKKKRPIVHGGRPPENKTGGRGEQRTFTRQLNIPQKAGFFFSFWFFNDHELFLVSGVYRPILRTWTVL